MEILSFMLVALQPCADAESQRNLEKTIYSTFSPSNIPNLPESAVNELNAQLEDGEFLSIWGVKSKGALKHWNKLSIGDLALFYADKNFFLQAKVIGKFESANIAEYLWGKDKEGKTFKYLYFLKTPSNIDIDVFSFNEAVGYKRTNFVQGFTVLDEEKSNKALSHFSSFQSLSGIYSSSSLLDKVLDTLRFYGGEASLEDIYTYIKKQFGFPAKYQDYPSLIRKTIYQHSSDADIFKGKKDLFYAVNEKGSGIWGIRDFISNSNTLPLTEDDESFPEGKQKLRQHLARERNSKLIRLAKERFKQQHGRLYCQACGFDFKASYGDLGEDFIEGHHTKPISELKDGEESKIEDIAMLCSNCHRMVHRKRPWLSMDELINLFR